MRFKTGKPGQLLSCVLLLGLLLGCVQYPGQGAGRRSFLWVSRYEYKTAADIARVMADAQAAGFSDVLFQVRANGTVFYDSSLEPWSEVYGFRAPGFDPLGVAVQEAGRRGIKLHAWINALAGWRGEVMPADANQLRRAHPGWFLRGTDGTVQQESGYMWLNPCLPEVRVHVAGICDEIASRYPVAGVHLDYIRFPEGEPQRRGPADPRSRQLFVEQTGVEEVGGSAWLAWRRDCVTDLVRKARIALHRQGRPIELSVAVHATLARTRGDLMQDWPRWARQGMVDAVFPMNYTADDGLFAERSRTCIEAADGNPVYMGIGSYKHASLRPGATLRQMDAALRSGAAGVSLFSYSSALGSADRAARLGHWHRGR